MRLPRGSSQFIDSRMTSKKPEPPELPQKDTAAIAQPSGTVCISGQALVDALAQSPLRDVDFEPEPYYPPVRDVVLDAEDFFEDRAARGKREGLLKFLDEVGDEQPIDGDRLP